MKSGESSTLTSFSNAFFHPSPEEHKVQNTVIKGRKECQNLLGSLGYWVLGNFNSSYPQNQCTLREWGSCHHVVKWRPCPKPMEQVAQLLFLQSITIFLNGRWQNPCNGLLTHDVNATMDGKAKWKISVLCVLKFTHTAHTCQSSVRLTQ